MDLSAAMQDFLIQVCSTWISVLIFDFAVFLLETS